MNNSEPLIMEEWLLLSAAFSGSLISFYLVYQATYHTFECFSRKGASWLAEYKKWTRQQKADFVSRITSQLHALIVISLSIKALFFTW